MSPVHSVQTMSDDELKKNFAKAQDHVRDVHSISSDHEDFDKSLNMHPFFKDVVAEYRKRGLDKSPEPPQPEASNEKKPTTITEIEEGCKLTAEEVEEGKKNLTSTEISEGVGSEVPEPVGQVASSAIPKEMTDDMTSSEVHQEEEALKEEGLEIQMGTENLGPGDTKQE